MKSLLHQIKQGKKINKQTTRHFIPKNHFHPCLAFTVVQTEQQTKQYKPSKFFVLFCRMSREQQAVARARKAFETGRSKPLEYRIYQLENLRRLFIERQAVIAEAIKKDLNKVTTPPPPSRQPPTIIDACLWVVISPRNLLSWTVTMS